jgi:hypothetical protein
MRTVAIMMANTDTRPILSSAQASDRVRGMRVILYDKKV